MGKFLVLGFVLTSWAWALQPLRETKECIDIEVHYELFDDDAHFSSATMKRFSVPREHFRPRSIPGRWNPQQNVIGMEDFPESAGDSFGEWITVNTKEGKLITSIETSQEDRSEILILLNRTTPPAIRLENGAWVQALPGKPKLVYELSANGKTRFAFQYSYPQADSRDGRPYTKIQTAIVGLADIGSPLSEYELFQWATLHPAQQRFLMPAESARLKPVEFEDYDEWNKWKRPHSLSEESARLPLPAIVVGEDKKDGEEFFLAVERSSLLRDESTYIYRVPKQGMLLAMDSTTWNNLIQTTRQKSARSIRRWLSGWALGPQQFYNPVGLPLIQKGQTEEEIILTRFEAIQLAIKANQKLCQFFIADRGK